MKKYFGTDGIRGKAYEFLNAELAFLVGQSLTVLKNKNLVIARDTRESGSMLAEAIIKGARSVGMNICDIGIVPTPMLAFVSKRLGFTGVMITASHNPYYDNGIKIFNKGTKLDVETEKLVEAILNKESSVELSQDYTVIQKPVNALLVYNELYTRISEPSELKIGLDLANGATYRVAKDIFSKISPNILFVGDNPDGRNINDGVGSTHLESIIKLVKDNNLDLGFAFDGDGDRLLVVDSEGTVYDGDILIYVIAKYLNKKNLLKKSTVVLTKMSNLGILKALKNEGIEYLLTDIGDKYVLKALEDNDLTIGGENSGHLINMDLLNTGDGILNAVYLVKVLTEEGKTLKELTSNIWMYPDKTKNIKNVDKNIANRPEVIEKINQLNSKYGTDGRVLVRASGTEDLIRVTVSCKDEAEVDRSIEDIEKLIRSFK